MPDRAYHPTIAGIDPDTPIVFLEDDRRYYRPQVLLVTDEDRAILKSARDREESREENARLLDKAWVRFSAAAAGLVLVGTFVIDVIHLVQGR